MRLDFQKKRSGIRCYSCPRFVYDEQENIGIRYRPDLSIAGPDDIRTHCLSLLPSLVLPKLSKNSALTMDLREGGGSIRRTSESHGRETVSFGKVVELGEMRDFC
jgi:hypothetical protein